MSAESSNIWDQDDEWAGVASSRERRKRQNRLHQRAYRAKKRLERFPVIISVSEKESQPPAAAAAAAAAAGLMSAAPSALVTQNETAARREQSRLLIAVLDQLPMLVMLRCTNLQEKIKEFLQTAFTNWGLNLPTPRDLPAVTKLNTFDALIRNALMLQIPFEYLETDDYNSLFNYHGPETPAASRPSLPESLRPTALQRAMTHHSWLDLFPIPKMRDNILRSVEAGIYDETALCETLVCELLNLDDGTNAALVVWGESWDAEGWEFSAEFFATWGPLLQGCDEVLASTNYWRRKRGARCLEFVLS